jgi:hypothetical protein
MFLICILEVASMNLNQIPDYPDSGLLWSSSDYWGVCSKSSTGLVPADFFIHYHLEKSICCFTTITHNTYRLVNCLKDSCNYIHHLL